MKLRKLFFILMLASGIARGADIQPPVVPVNSKSALSQQSESGSGKGHSITRTNDPKSEDRLVLDPTLVTGNRELPKVMYIVPWKAASPGDLPGQPFNSLLDEALKPLDREVFQRELKYYRAVAEKDVPVADIQRRPSSTTGDKK